MKYAVVLILLLVPMIALGQSSGATGTRWNKAQLFKTYTTYTATSDDTSGFVSIDDPAIGSDPLLASELEVIFYATDSVAADVYFIGTNGALPYGKALNHGLLAGTMGTYADSLPQLADIAFSATTPYMKVIPLKMPGVNRLPGNTKFKIGVVFRATGQGTTAGRTLKIYTKWKR